MSSGVFSAANVSWKIRAAISARSAASSVVPGRLVGVVMPAFYLRLQPFAPPGHSREHHDWETKMRHGITASIAGVVVLLASVAPTSARMLAVVGLDDYGQRDEINETYTLSPGAAVTINDISGPVEIETWSGEQAEVHIVRSARRAE